MNLLPTPSPDPSPGSSSGASGLTKVLLAIGALAAAGVLVGVLLWPRGKTSSEETGEKEKEPVETFEMGTLPGDTPVKTLRVVLYVGKEGEPLEEPVNLRLGLGFPFRLYPLGTADRNPTVAAFPSKSSLAAKERGIAPGESAWFEFSAEEASSPAPSALDELRTSAPLLDGVTVADLRMIGFASRGETDWVLSGYEIRVNDQLLVAHRGIRKAATTVLEQDRLRVEEAIPELEKREQALADQKAFLEIDDTEQNRADFAKKQKEVEAFARPILESASRLAGTRPWFVEQDKRLKLSPPNANGPQQVDVKLLVSGSRDSGSRNPLYLRVGALKFPVTGGARPLTDAPGLQSFAVQSATATFPPLTKEVREKLALGMLGHDGRQGPQPDRARLQRVLVQSGDEILFDSDLEAADRITLSQVAFLPPAHRGGNGAPIANRPGARELHLWRPGLRLPEEGAKTPDGKTSEDVPQELAVNDDDKGSKEKPKGDSEPDRSDRNSSDRDSSSGRDKPKDLDESKGEVGDDEGDMGEDETGDREGNSDEKPSKQKPSKQTSGDDDDLANVVDESTKLPIKNNSVALLQGETLALSDEGKTKSQSSGKQGKSSTAQGKGKTSSQTGSNRSSTPPQGSPTNGFSSTTGRTSRPTARRPVLRGPIVSFLLLLLKQRDLSRTAHRQSLVRRRGKPSGGVANRRSRPRPSGANRARSRPSGVVRKLRAGRPQLSNVRIYSARGRVIDGQPVTVRWSVGGDSSQVSHYRVELMPILPHRSRWQLRRPVARVERARGGSVSITPRLAGATDANLDADEQRLLYVQPRVRAFSVNGQSLGASRLGPALPMFPSEDSIALQVGPHDVGAGDPGFEVNGNGSQGPWYPFSGPNAPGWETAVWRLFRPTTIHSGLTLDAYGSLPPSDPHNHSLAIRPKHPDETVSVRFDAWNVNLRDDMRLLAHIGFLDGRLDNAAAAVQARVVISDPQRPAAAAQGSSTGGLELLRLETREAIEIQKLGSRGSPNPCAALQIPIELNTSAAEYRAALANTPYQLHSLHSASGLGSQNGVALTVTFMIRLENPALWSVSRRQGNREAVGIFGVRVTPARAARGTTPVSTPPAVQ